MRSQAEQAMRTRKLVVSAILCALALALSLVDSAVSAALPFIPGFKLGLANIVSMLALYTLGLPYTLLIVLARCLLAALFSGNMMMLAFSLAGGLVSLLLMFALQRWLSPIKVSVAGGVAHNMMQVAVAVLFTSTPQAAYYLPLLVVTGAVSGFVMGMLCMLLLRSGAAKRLLRHRT